MKIGYIELGKEKHPMCFSISASEEICERFGSLDGMAKALDDKDTATRLSAIDSVLSIMMDAGRKACEIIGEEIPSPPAFRPADVIDVRDALDAIYGTISRDSARTVEAKPKKDDPAPAG